MCTLSIKVPLRKKSENLFNDPRVKILFSHMDGPAEINLLLPNDGLLSFSSYYMILLRMKIVYSYINYHTLNTPGDL